MKVSKVLGQVERRQVSGLFGVNDRVSRLDVQAAAGRQERAQVDLSISWQSAVSSNPSQHFIGVSFVCSRAAQMVRVIVGRKQMRAERTG